MNIYNATRTIYNVKLQTHMMANLPYTPLPNTTLNEKFNILEYKQHRCLPTEGRPIYPTIKGIMLGNGGAEILDSDLGNMKLGKHSPVDGALFNHIPFVIRPEEEDLLGEERAKYRFRREMYIDGKKHYGYYIKLFTDKDLYYRPEILCVDNSKVVPSIKIFNTDRSDILNPVPEKDNRMSTYENSIYTVNILRFEFKLSDNELRELQNVFKLLKIKDYLLTELAVVTGIDWEDEEYNDELIYTQVAYFIDISLNLEAINDKILVTNIEIGGGEIIPLRKELTAQG